MKKLIVIIIILFTFAPVIHAQEADKYLKNFFAIQQGETVYLRWTIEAGNTCEGTRIQHSTDGITYTETGEIPGVCGSPDQPVSYDYTDSVPVVNQYNYYRLEMGLLGYSSPLFVEVVILNDNGYTIQPNPVVNTSILRFDNPDSESHEVCLINSMGSVVFSIITTSDRVEIDSRFLASGTYIFKILNNNSLKARGKIIVKSSR